MSLFRVSGLLVLWMVATLNTGMTTASDRITDDIFRSVWGDSICLADLGGMGSGVSKEHKDWLKRTVFIQLNGTDQHKKVMTNKRMMLAIKGQNSFCFGGSYGAGTYITDLELNMTDSRFCVKRSLSTSDTGGGSTVSMVNSVLSTADFTTYHSTLDLANVAIGGLSDNPKKPGTFHLKESEVVVKAPKGGGDPRIGLHVSDLNLDDSILKAFGGFRVIVGPGDSRGSLTMESSRLELCAEDHKGSLLGSGYLLSVKGMNIGMRSSLKIDCNVNFIIHGYPEFHSSSLRIENPDSKLTYCVFSPDRHKFLMKGINMTINVNKMQHRKEGKFTIGCGATVDEALRNAISGGNEDRVWPVKGAVRKFGEPAVMSIAGEPKTMVPCPSSGRQNCNIRFSTSLLLLLLAFASLSSVLLFE